MKILLICLLFIHTGAKAQDASAVFKKASKSTGLITDNKNWGSGFFINGKVFVTNYHVIKGMNGYNAEIRTQANTFSVNKIIDINKDVDIAILEITDSSSFFLSLADPKEISVGQKIFAIGNPVSPDAKVFKNTFTEGIINNITKDKIEQREFKINSKVILHSAELNPGNSGGPLINFNSEVVGINAYVRYNIEMMKFAIHIDELISLLDKNGISYTKGNNINSTSSEESNNNNNNNTIGSLDSLISGKKIINNDTASILLNSVNDQDNTLLYVFLFIGVSGMLFVIILFSGKKNKSVEISMMIESLPDTLTHDSGGTLKMNKNLLNELPRSYLLYNDRRIDLPVTEMIIGRDSTCDISINDNNLSRFHSKIRFSEGKYYIIDMESKNGTFINAKNIRSKILTNGDIISVGNSKLLFKVSL